MRREAWLTDRRSRWPELLCTLSMPIEYSPKVPTENSSLRCGSIAAIATRRLDVGEDIKIEIGDGVQDLGGGAVAEAIWQGVAPGGVLGLQSEQFGDRVTPALRPGASICRPAPSDRWKRLLLLAAGTVPGLSFGITERVVTFRLAASWHGEFSVT